MSSADEIRRNIVKRSSLEEANRVYHNLTNETTVNGGYNTPPGKPYPFFVPSTVKSTLGSPVSILMDLLKIATDKNRLRSRLGLLQLL